MNEAGEFRSLNPAAARALGRPAEELVGRRLEDLFPPDIGRCQAEALQRVFATGESVLARENETQTVLGRRLYSTSLTPVSDGNGQVAYVLGTARDITEARQHEAQVRQSERFLQGVFDGIQDGISVLDRDLRIVRVNHWIETMYAAEAPLVGRKCFEVYHRADSPCAQCPTLRALATGEPHREVVPYATAGEQRGWVDVSAFPLRDDNGDVVGVIEHVRDVTEQKRTTELLQRHATQAGLLRDLLVHLNTLDTTEALLEAALETAVALASAEGGGLYLVEPRRQMAVLRRHRGLPAGFTAQVREVPLSHPAVQAALRAPTVAHPAELAAASPELAAVFGESGLRQVYVIPLRTPDAVLGFISVATTREGSLDEQARDALAHVGASAAAALGRRRADEARRQSEERNRLLLASLPHSIFFKDREGRFVSVNGAFAGELGMEPGDIIGKTDFDLYPTELAAKYQADDQRVMAVGRAETLVERNVAAGRERIVEVMKAPVIQDDGQVLGVMGLFTDITEQRRAEMEMARLATAAEQAGEAIIIADPRGIIEYVNPAFERITGFAREDIVGQDVQALRGGESVAFFRDEIGPEVQQGRVWSGRFTNPRQDGRPIEVEVTVSPVRDASGSIVNIVAVARDVTQEAALEAQLRQTQKLEAIGALAGGVAHDFNNLLTGILGYANILKLHSQPGDAVFKAADVIEGAARRAAELTGQLLGFARKGKHQNAPVDLHAAIQEVIGLLSRTIPKDITISQRFGAEAATVLGDPSQMQQVVLNLAINARDAMPNGGELSFETDIVELDEEYCARHAEATRGRHVTVAVTDTGCGIPDEVRERIFEPFFTTKGRGEGTGMGLAMAYGIVKNHNGFIQVYSEVGRGSTFRVYLPLLTAPAPEAGAGRPATLVAGTGRILLVDDEEVVREVAVDMLRHLGYQVVTASDGRQALEYYRQCGAEVDLVILDMVMPHLDGRGCFRALKQINPQVRAILSTGYGLNGAAQALLDEGMVGFVQKPYEAGQLSAVVADVIRRSPE